MIECLPQDKETVFAKLDRLYMGDIDYLEQLFGMLEEANIKDPSWPSLISEFENTLFFYDEWTDGK